MNIKNYLNDVCRQRLANQVKVYLMQRPFNLSQQNIFFCLAETNETNDDNGEVPASEDSGPSESGEESVDGNESKAINDSDRELTSGANSGDINMYTLTGADEQLSPTGDVDQKSVSVHNDLE